RHPALRALATGDRAQPVGLVARRRRRLRRRGVRAPALPRAVAGGAGATRGSGDARRRRHRPARDVVAVDRSVRRGYGGYGGYVDGGRPLSPFSPLLWNHLRNAVSCFVSIALSTR